METDNQSNQGANDGLKQWNNTNIDTWAQELKLSSKNQNIKWIGGLYFDKEKREQGPYGYEQDYYGSVYTGDTNSEINSETQAIFGQTMIPIYQKLELTLGARYQKIEKDIDLIGTSSWGGISFPDLEYQDKKDWNSFLPKAALSYFINDNLTTFLSYSNGYMPGGFNTFPSTNVSNDNTFEPQKSNNYELGIKYTEETYLINTSIFRMNIEDIHVYKQLGAQFITDNAKKAHSEGIEIDGKYFSI